ncbi:DUF6411 family protein [Streptomyces sp. NPDC005955]|uniref:DUF6411 family protein n=1 Tax=Streptomyces sp. NPDC005955 TaxID=3364738 RepID=UPI0036D1381D
MIIVAVIALCLVLAVLAFLLPRLSRHPERGTLRSLGLGARAGGKAPGILGRMFSKPFSTSARAVSRSGSAGRRARNRLPF